MTYIYRNMILTACILGSSLYLSGQTSGDSIKTKYLQNRAIAFASQPDYQVSSAISTVSGAELEKTFTPNIWNTLIGRLPGFTVMQGSEEPGSFGTSYAGRGIATFTGNNAPLILIDGYQSTINHLVPEEIETVTFLKDASATAIYGLRGANGVLLVTTKRGIESPLKISFSTQVGFQQATRLPEYLRAYDFARLYNEAEANNGVKTPTYKEEDLQAYLTGSDPLYHPDIDWYDQVLRKAAPLYNFDLNFRGGNKIVKYYVMLNMLGNNGLLKRTTDLSEDTKNETYQKYNVRTNMDINVTKNFSAHVTLGLSVEDNVNPGGQNTSSLFNTLDYINPNSFPVKNPNGTYGGNTKFNNPLGMIAETGYWSYNARNLNSALRLTEKLDMITPGLSASAAIAFNSYYIGYSNKTKDVERFSITKGADEEPIYELAGGQDETLTGDESQSDQWRNTTLQAFLNYDRTFGKHQLNAMAMYEYEERYVGAVQPYRHIGFGGRFTYTNNNRYIAEFSFGTQASENFLKHNSFFPAGSLGWIVSQEDFLKNNNIIKYLKLRTSYGLTGNDEIGGDRFMYDQEYIYTSDYFLGTTSKNHTIRGLMQGRLANPDISWEKERKFNIGFETNLLGKLDISFDYFYNRRFDILCIPSRNIPSYIGADMPYMNLGKTKNQGFEASIRWSDNIGKKIQYFAQLDGWMAKNKILYNSESIQTEDYFYRTGRQINQPYYLEALGFYTEEDIQNPDVAKPAWQNVQAGDIKYKDQNGDNIIDSNDWYPIGKTSIPEITLGLNLGCTFYGFDFTAFFQSALNRDVYLDAPYYRAFQGRGNVSKAALNRWTPETAATATYPRLSASDDQNNYQGSTFWLKNGNFLKLRNIELGYTFKNLISTAKTTADLRIFVNGTNLFSIDHIKDLDPEIMSGYPALRTISFGAKVQF